MKEVYFSYPLVWDDDDDENGNVEHLWSKRKIYKWQIDDVIFDDPDLYVGPNRKVARRIMVIGEDRGGKCWTISLEPINRRKGIWKPITAWEAEDYEKEIYERKS